MKLRIKQLTTLFSRNICYASTRFIARSKHIRHVSEYGIMEIEINKKIPNPTIKKQHSCEYCNGTGYIPCYGCDFSINKHCSVCNDKWYIVCEICGGSGISHTIFN